MTDRHDSGSPAERRIIAVCASWEDVENLNLILNRLIEETAGTGYLPMCVAFDRSSVEARGDESIRELLAAFDVPNLAGFLLLGEMIRNDRINLPIIEFAKKKSLPVFMMERQYEGCINLCFTYRDGFEQVARHLVEEHGCRDFVMVAGIKGNSYSEERIELLRNLLREHGSDLPQEKVLYGDYWDEPTFRALTEYFNGGGSMPEAFLCANDAMAITVCVFLSERNVQVPGQVLVGGFDGILPGESHEPSITTARPDFAFMFSTMLRRMDTWQAEETGRTEYLSVPFELLPRESCGCAEGSPFVATKKIGELKLSNLEYTRHIRKMGIFIRNTLNLESIDGLAGALKPLIFLWPYPYFFTAMIAEEDSQSIPILYGRNSTFTDAVPFSRKEKLLPDGTKILTDPEIRIIMVQLLQNQEETMGYLVSGIHDWTLREQERFEETAIFLSSALNAVIRNRRLRNANKEILRMAEHDYLTNLYNRRGFLRELEHQLQLEENRGKVLTLFAMDMDRLKSINDIYGHQAGDQAIQALAAGIRTAMEGRGICARYGGDEFAFAAMAEKSLLPELEEIRENIQNTARRVCGTGHFLISASLGAASCPVANHPPMDQILAESDHALYKDKSLRHSQGAGAEKI
ncbi:MAG: diguanylate cyclase [Clostridia bacterium]|nr:diguanylate cyclase [Clostridia bacterium]